MSPHIAIITVVYNNYTVLDEFFESLAKQTDKDFHVFIADASSKKKDIIHTSIPVTVLPIENLGYAHGINVGIEEAIKKGIEKYVVINDDVYFEKNFITEIKTSFEKHPRSLIGGKIYYAPGYEYHKDRYKKEELGKVFWFAGGKTDWAHALTYHVGVDEVDTGQYDTESSTDFITGCMVCFDKKVVDIIGLWDTSYFLYYEDADYCERAKRKNIPLIYNPQIRLWHKNAQSTDGSGSKLHEHYQEKSRIRFALTYAPIRTKLHIMKNYLLSNLTSRKA